MYWNDHMGAGGWVFAILGMIIVLALVVGLAFWLVSKRRDRFPSGDAPTATEILDRRLASGELTVEQYGQVRRTLDDSPTRGPEQRPAHPVGAAS